MANYCSVLCLCVAAVACVLSIAFMSIAISTDNWQHVSGTCHKLSQNVTNYHKMSQTITKCRKISNKVTNITQVKLRCFYNYQNKHFAGNFYLNFVVSV